MLAVTRRWSKIITVHLLRATVLDAELFYLWAKGILYRRAGGYNEDSSADIESNFNELFEKTLENLALLEDV